MDQLVDFIKARLNRLTCGETGYLQCSAWEALDRGLSFDTWVEAVAIAENHWRPMNTLRKQFRLCEVDRNACLVDDGEPEKQTYYSVLGAKA